MPSDSYDPEFFKNMGFGPDDDTINVLRAVFKHYRPNSLVDTGCGNGKWVATAWMLGVEDCVGVDGEYVPRESRFVPPSKFVECDIENMPLRLGRKFDLALCLEVVEHHSRDRSESFVEELCELSDIILFSAALPFQGGTQHVNEQWLEYWGIMFRKNDYVPVDIRQLIL